MNPDGNKTFIWMADRWNFDGPGGLDEATLIWLPLVSVNEIAQFEGSALVEAICDANDPNQQWTMPKTLGSLIHKASALCVQGVSSTSSLTL